MSLFGPKKRKPSHPTVKTLPLPAAEEACDDCSRLFITPNNTGSCWADSITTALFYPAEPRRWIIDEFLPAAEAFLEAPTEWDQERLGAMRTFVAELKMLVDLYGGAAPADGFQWPCPKTSPTVEFAKHLHKAANWKGYDKRWNSGKIGSSPNKELGTMMRCFLSLSEVVGCAPYERFFVFFSLKRFATQYIEREGDNLRTATSEKDHRIPLYVRTEDGRVWRAASVVMGNRAAAHAVCFVRCREKPWVWMMNHAQGSATKTSSAIRFELESMNPFEEEQPQLPVVFAAKKMGVPLAEYNSSTCRATVLFESLPEDFPLTLLLREELWVPVFSKHAEPLLGLSDGIDASLDMATRLFFENHDLQTSLRLSGLQNF